MVSQFIDFLSGQATAGEAALSYLRSQIGRTSVIRTGLSFGLPGSAILRAMRANGMGMRTQNFYQLTNQLKESSGTEPGWTWGGPGTTIDPSDVNQLEGGRAGQYMVNVRAYYTATDEDGDIESGYRTMSILQDDLDLDQAIADAQGIDSQGSMAGTGAPGTVTGWDISSVNQWQGK